MMADRTSIDIWVMMDESGRYVVAANEDDLGDLADSELDEDEDHRCVHLKLSLSGPDSSKVASGTYTVEID
jgi:hypothetical protein